MANIRLIRQRIKSAQNIAQITKAMEMVAASKMRKAQAAAVSGKIYAQKIYEMVIRLAAKADAAHHPLLARPDVGAGKRLVVVLSSNKGLCGGLNANLFRFLLSEYRDMANIDYISLGKKGTAFFVRTGATLKADFSDTANIEAKISALTDMIVGSFIAKEYHAVDLVYNDFVSVIKQLPKKKTILPLTIEQGTPESESHEFLIEPNVAEVFDALLPHYLENQIRDAVLEAEASEHSSRMIAMRNATDNAVSLTQELTLLYNKARQEKITYEITDMVTARLAVAE
ncbi:MAG: ATP synthase gamma chain [Candidatus Gottesmanbacteria bacterium GW2011_GWA2_47_9]|uniref:ATP synthase gamma chain n=1 Tax=Candidatus Gottesmanbacteria bacterium GW2011_GWA2_47_9 TaxID=1618445 RepID=A0A0G1U038_9BACT|nr:MAG: ATP synthase gamma chain [Candidatus Gottesmanbacteria bacterium GW2011_GWA2_47_9]